MKQEVQYFQPLTKSDGYTVILFNCTFFTFVGKNTESKWFILKTFLLKNGLNFKYDDDFKSLWLSLNLSNLNLDQIFIDYSYSSLYKE